MPQSFKTVAANRGSNTDLLKLALSHVLYEMEMVAGVSEIIWNGRPPQNFLRIVERNALIEAFVIHVRSLTEFFAPRDRPRVDDIRPEHFVTGFSPVLPDREQLERMHKEVVHLTYARNARNKRVGWSRRGAPKDVALASLRFLGAINEQHPDWRILVYPGGRFSYGQRIDRLRLRLGWAASEEENTESAFDCSATAASAPEPNDPAAPDFGV